MHAHFPTRLVTEKAEKECVSLLRVPPSKTVRNVDAKAYSKKALVIREDAASKRASAR
ncbi:hypothetical protein [Caulobacter sp. LARHSG274]